MVFAVAGELLFRDLCSPFPALFLPISYRELSVREEAEEAAVREMSLVLDDTVWKPFTAVPAGT